MDLTTIYAALCFLVYLLVWIVTDPRRWPEPVLMYFRPSFIPMTLGFLLVLCILVLQIVWFPMPSTSYDMLIIGIGVLLTILGLGLGIWAKLTMSKNWGLPMQHDFKRQNELVTSGPFAYTRNPIYVALILLWTGIFLVLRSPVVLVMIIVAWKFAHSVAKEEQFLEKYFGNKYLDYKKKVPRFLFS